MNQTQTVEREEKRLRLTNKAKEGTFGVLPDTLLGNILSFVECGNDMFNFSRASKRFRCVTLTEVGLWTTAFAPNIRSLRVDGILQRAKENQFLSLRSCEKHFEDRGFERQDTDNDEDDGEEEISEEEKEKNKRKEERNLKNLYANFVGLHENEEWPEFIKEDKEDHLYDPPEESDCDEDEPTEEEYTSTEEAETGADETREDAEEEEVLSEEEQKRIFNSTVVGVRKEFSIPEHFLNWVRWPECDLCGTYYSLERERRGSKWQGKSVKGEYVFCEEDIAFMCKECSESKHHSCVHEYDMDVEECTCEESTTVTNC